MRKWSPLFAGSFDFLTKPVLVNSALAHEKQFANLAMCVKVPANQQFL
jgi:hypothetical protein